MYFVDNRLVPEEIGARIRNLLLLCAAIYVSYNVLFIYIFKKKNQQSGIIYKIASGLKHFVENSYAFILPFQKEFMISLAIAAVIILISFILVGMPGGLLIGAIQKLGIFNTIKGDNVWPAALYASFFWPLCLPIAVLTKYYLIQQGYIGYALLGLCLSSLVWILAVVASVFLLFGNATK
jgi:hypothetical protein